MHEHTALGILGTPRGRPSAQPWFGLRVEQPGGDEDAGHPARLRASEAPLAVEVLSEGTRRVDRVLKFSEYGDAGIPQYWIVDLDPPTTLTAYLLVDGEYELVARSGGAVDLDVAGYPVRLDLAALTRR